MRATLMAIMKMKMKIKMRIKMRMAAEMKLIMQRALYVRKIAISGQII